MEPVLQCLTRALCNNERNWVNVLFRKLLMDVSRLRHFSTIYETKGFLPGKQMITLTNSRSYPNYGITQTLTQTAKMRNVSLVLFRHVVIGKEGQSLMSSVEIRRQQRLPGQFSGLKRVKFWSNPLTPPVRMRLCFLKAWPIFLKLHPRPCPSQRRFWLQLLTWQNCQRMSWLTPTLKRLNDFGVSTLPIKSRMQLWQTLSLLRLQIRFRDLSGARSLWISLSTSKNSLLPWTKGTSTLTTSKISERVSLWLKKSNPTRSALSGTNLNGFEFLALGAQLWGTFILTASQNSRSIWRLLLMCSELLRGNLIEPYNLTLKPVIATLKGHSGWMTETSSTFRSWLNSFKLLALNRPYEEQSGSIIFLRHLLRRNM